MFDVLAQMKFAPSFIANKHMIKAVLAQSYLPLIHTIPNFERVAESKSYDRWSDCSMSFID